MAQKVKDKRTPWWIGRVFGRLSVKGRLLFTGMTPKGLKLKVFVRVFGSVSRGLSRPRCAAGPQEPRGAGQIAISQRA